MFPGNSQTPLTSTEVETFTPPTPGTSGSGAHSCAKLMLTVLPPSVTVTTVWSLVLPSTVSTPSTSAGAPTVNVTSVPTGTSSTENDVSPAVSVSLPVTVWPSAPS